MYCTAVRSALLYGWSMRVGVRHWELCDHRGLRGFVTIGWSNGVSTVKVRNLALVSDTIIFKLSI